MTAAPRSAEPAHEPTLDRPITLTFQGDWGQANLHRICGWLAQEVGDRSPADSTFLIRSGRGGADAVSAVLSGVVDVALMTPVAAINSVTARHGDADGRLRALGTLPQRDRLVTCVDAALGVSSMDELVDHMAHLRVATSPDDGVNLVGLAAHRQLQALGIESDALRDAGGSFMYWERPFPALSAFRDGAANVLIQEAVMTPAWLRIAENRPVTYLDATTAVLDSFTAFDWPSAVVPSGFLPELTRDLTAVEFSDFLMVCSVNLADDIASLLAWCMIATREALEVQYRHLPAERSPVTYPLDPQDIASAPIALHPAAAAAYAAIDPHESSSVPPVWA